MYRKDLKDEFYTRKARAEGYPARSVYKLQQINERFRVIKRNNIVLDLGSAPGSWLLYISQVIGPKGKVVGIDIEDINIPKRNNIVFFKKDALNLKEEDLKEIRSNFNVVVADLAPKTSGVIFTDVGKCLELNRCSFELVNKVLARGGNFIFKIFEGEDVNEFVKEVSKSFQTTKRFRPPATMKKSREIYIICKGFIRQ